MALIEHIDIDDLPLKFGKHEGLTPNEIAELDPDYIIWMYENIDPPPCSSDLVMAAELELVEKADAEEYQLKQEFIWSK